MAIEHANARILRAIYADLSSIDKYVDDDVVLHTADREISVHATKIIGREAVLNKELELIQATNNTLFMDVEKITANDYFGSVFGVLRIVTNGQEQAMPFCGLWRFREG